MTLPFFTLLLLEPLNIDTVFAENYLTTMIDKVEQPRHQLLQFCHLIHLKENLSVDTPQRLAPGKATTKVTPGCSICIDWGIKLEKLPNASWRQIVPNDHFGHPIYRGDRHQGFGVTNRVR